MLVLSVKLAGVMRFEIKRDREAAHQRRLVLGGSGTYHVVMAHRYCRVSQEDNE